MNKIIDALDIAKNYNHPNAKTWMIEHSERMHEKNPSRVIFNGVVDRNSNSIAYIDFGRWMVNCPFCDSICYCSVAEEMAYCFSCGGRGTGRAFGIVLPVEREKIEQALLKRPVTSNEHEKNILLRVIQERPIIEGLPRSWNHFKDITDLIRENKDAEL